MAKDFFGFVKQLNEISGSDQDFPTGLKPGQRVHVNDESHTLYEMATNKYGVDYWKTAKGKRLYAGDLGE